MQLITAFLTVGQIKTNPEEAALATQASNLCLHPRVGALMSLRSTQRVPEQPGSVGWDPTSHLGALPLQSWKGRNPPALLCCALPRLILGPFCVLSSPDLITVLNKPLQKAGEGPRHSKYWKAMTVAGKQHCLGQISATAFLWRHSREIAQRTQSST